MHLPPDTQRETDILPKVDHRTVVETVDAFIRDHGKPMKILAGEPILSLLKGFDIPVRFASGLSKVQIVFLT